MQKMDAVKKELNIIHLNDFCLIEIFKYLSFGDLFELHKVDSRIHKAIGTVLYQKNVKVTIEDENILQIQSFLKIFKGQVRNLELSVLSKSSKARAKILISLYCSDGVVEHFTSSYTIDSQFLSEFIGKNKDFFKTLKTIEFHNGQMEDSILNMMFEQIPAIQTMRFIGIINTIIDFLPKLVRCQLHTFEGILLDILGNTANVENLPTISSIKTLILSTTFSELTVLNCFPNVENLNLTVLNYDAEFPNSLSIIKNLKNLKQLTLVLESVSKVELESFLSAMADINKLDYLSLKLCQYVEKVNFETNLDILPILCKFTNLKSLCLNTSWQFKSSLITLATNLTQLNRLEIKGDEMKFNKKFEILGTVCGIVSNAKNLHSLSTQFSCDEKLTKHFYEQLYDEISTIRENQSSKTILDVYVVVPKGSRCFIQTHKLVKMTLK